MGRRGGREVVRPAAPRRVPLRAGVRRGARRPRRGGGGTAAHRRRSRAAGRSFARGDRGAGRVAEPPRAGSRRVGARRRRWHGADRRPAHGDGARPGDGPARGAGAPRGSAARGAHRGGALRWPRPHARLSADRRPAWDVGAAGTRGGGKRRTPTGRRRGSGLAEMASTTGDGAGAERALRQALKVEPDFVPAVANLADFLRQTGRDPEGEALLRDAIKRWPNQAALQEALALSLVRQQRKPEALQVLARARGAADGDGAHPLSPRGVARRRGSPVRGHRHARGGSEKASGSRPAARAGELQGAGRRRGRDPRQRSTGSRRSIPAIRRSRGRAEPVGPRLVPRRRLREPALRYDAARRRLRRRRDDRTREADHGGAGEGNAGQGRQGSGGGRTDRDQGDGAESPDRAGAAPFRPHRAQRRGTLHLLLRHAQARPPRRGDHHPGAARNRGRSRQHGQVPARRSRRRRQGVAQVPGFQDRGRRKRERDGQVGIVLDAGRQGA